MVALVSVQVRRSWGPLEPVATPVRVAPRDALKRAAPTPDSPA